MASDFPAPHVLVSQPSLLQDAIQTHRAEVSQTLASLLATKTAREAGEPSSFDLAASVPNIELSGCVFVGHTATDMDSIASAIGAAELFQGTAARASDINTETEFALNYWGLPCPPPFLDVGLERPVCLVDHNQASQMTAGIDKAWIRGIIDHHALQAGTVVTDAPIYVDIRPWGSACTIIAHMFVAQHRLMTRTTAGMLLCGILSDTLNMRSPTTTNADRVLVGLLTEVAEVADPDDLAKQMFKAKSKMLSTLSSHALIRGDNKTFCFKSAAGVETKIAFGVVETVDPDAVMEHEEELLMELRAHKKETGVDLSFLAIVDVVNLVSTLLLCSRDEEALAVEAFECRVDEKHWAADLGSRVSRKKDFVPPLSAVLERGWQRPPPRVSPKAAAAAANGEDHQSHDFCADEQEEEEVFGQVIHECCGERGCITRRLPSMPNVPSLRRSQSEGGPTVGGGRPPLVAHVLQRQHSL